MIAGPPLDYRCWIKIGLPPRFPESVPGCPGPWATPFFPFLAKTGGSRWDFCRDYFFQFLHTDGLDGSQYRCLIFWYHYVRRKNLGVFSTGSTGPQITSSPPFIPTNESLRSFLQQDVQPSLAHPATQPHLLGTNALRCASVDSHITNTLHCCTSSSCSTFPAIPGAHATNFESRIYI